MTNKEWLKKIATATSNIISLCTTSNNPLKSSSKPAWQQRAKSGSLNMKFSLSLKKPLEIDLRKMK